jgi:hypothetical protein
LQQSRITGMCWRTHRWAKLHVRDELEAIRIHKDWHVQQ